MPGNLHYRLHIIAIKDLCSPIWYEAFVDIVDHMVSLHFIISFLDEVSQQFMCCQLHEGVLYNNPSKFQIIWDNLDEETVKLVKVSVC
jgi:hypothetical protein